MPEGGANNPGVPPNGGRLGGAGNAGTPGTFVAPDGAATGGAPALIGATVGNGGVADPPVAPLVATVGMEPGAAGADPPTGWTPGRGAVVLGGGVPAAALAAAGFVCAVGSDVAVGSFGTATMRVRP